MPPASGATHGGGAYDHANLVLPAIDYCVLLACNGF